MAALPGRQYLVQLALLALSLLFAACGGTGAIEASDVWARESPATAQTGAIYMELHNNTRTADALVGIETPACGQPELHESAMDENGVMRMAPVPGGRIELPAGSHAVLAPGGLHIMCLELADPFVLGETIPLTLQFAVHEPLAIEAEIRSDSP